MKAQAVKDALPDSPGKYSDGKRETRTDLVFWPSAPGVCRFQTDSPQIARKLSQRSGARLVAWSVEGGYLRVFEERIEPWRARRLVTRFLRPTNGAFSRRISPLSRRKSRRVSTRRRAS